MLICAADCFRIPASARRRIARWLSFSFPAAAKILDAVQKDNLHKYVLFISLRPHTRETRLAQAARIAGWEPILVYAGGDLKYEVGKFFYLHARVGGLFRLLWVIWYFRGPLVHVFAPDGAQAYLLCKAKTGRLILDINDTTMSHLLNINPRIWHYCEREAIRAADGMTHRDLRVKYLQKLYGYSLPRYNILVQDPLTEVPTPQSKVRKRDDIHVVSSGFVGIGENAIVRTLRALCADRIHVHMYTMPLQRQADQELKPYFELQQQSEYFHWKDAVYGESYWTSLTSCDFGLVAYEPFVFGEIPTLVTLDALRGNTSSRLMDYAQAGLGIIIPPGVAFQWFLARRYAPVTVALTREFLARPRAALESALREKASARKKNLQAITTSGVARRLGMFYEKVARPG